MKGTITNCLAELVENKFGKDKWKAIMTDAGVADGTTLRMAIADVDDKVAMQLLTSTSKVLGISEQAAADAFGEYWCCTYAPRLYGSVLKQFKNAKELIVGLDDIHVKVTATMPNARPPRFKYNWLSEKELEVTYLSQRNLRHVYVGLARGVGLYYKTPLKVSASGQDKVRIVWP